MNFKRLIVFGDSFTYGHGLPDCHVEPVYPGPLPSKMGWVSRLAKFLNIQQVINLSYPGCSNRYIAHTVVDFNDFKNDDLIITQFTFFSRDFYFDEDTNRQSVGGWNLDFKNSTELVKHWEYYLDRSKQELILRSYEYILLTYFFLQHKNTTFYFLSHENLSEFSPYLFSLNNNNVSKIEEGFKWHSSLFINNTYDLIKNKFVFNYIMEKTAEYGKVNKDLALDNSHWGLKTQEFCAKLIFNFFEKKPLNLL